MFPVDLYNDDIDCATSVDDGGLYQSPDTHWARPAALRSRQISIAIGIREVSSGVQEWRLHYEIQAEHVPDSRNCLASHLASFNIPQAIAYTTMDTWLLTHCDELHVNT
jgi:hypothetical protein